MKLINEAFTLEDHERWKGKKIVRVPKLERLACPECQNFTTIGESFDWRCSKCGVLLRRVNPKTLKPLSEENETIKLRESLEHLKSYVRNEVDSLVTSPNQAEYLIFHISHAIDHIIGDHCRDK